MEDVGKVMPVSAVLFILSMRSNFVKRKMTMEITWG